MKIKIISAPNQKAFGGNLQSQGATWSNGYSYAGNGGTHESNPNEGIQVGVDPQGIPNLIEEGEVMWNDFVFTNRINVPKKDMKEFGIKSKKPISYADAAMKVAEESKERPNDPISKAGLNRMLSMIADSQEVEKQKRAQRQAKNAFNQMSPEDQLGIMQLAQAAQQQSQMPQEQELPQEQEMPVEGMPIEENPYGAMGDVNMSAFGGFINKFRKGGYKQQRIAKQSEADMKWFKARAKALGIELGDDFTLDPNDRAANLEAFNILYRDAQKKKAYDNYLKGQTKHWENEELGSGRYKKSDDNKKVYKAKYYDDVDLDKEYISSENVRKTKAEYNAELEEYNKLKKKAKPTDEEKAKIKAFEKASYKTDKPIKGQFVRDYNGNIVYDYDTDVTNTWHPSDEELGKDFKWEDTNAAKVAYDYNPKDSALSYLKFAPAIGGAIGLMTDAFSRPDYSRAEEIKKAGAYTAPSIDYKPIGNYLRYNPLDINYQQNRLNQEAAATRRAINNTAGTRGAALASILATDYNAQQQSGDFYRKALEYNDALQQKVEDFNRTTNTFNSTQDLAVQKANQAATIDALKNKYTGIVAGNTLMDTIDARRAASINANLTNTVNSLGEIGKYVSNQDLLDRLIHRDVIKDIKYDSNKGVFSGSLGGRLKKKRRGGNR